MPINRRFSELLLSVILPVILLSCAPCFAQSGDTLRPTIGLVLGGGGARGGAHVGIIKVLDELRIPVDYIAGTSMGAIVGGLYASGMDAAELEETIRDADWSRLLADRPPRAQRSYRRKGDDFGFLVDFDVGVGKDGLIFPQGLVQGQTLTLELKKLLMPVVTIDDFDRLPIPFRALATDIISGDAVILDSGDLATAIRASMSVPGLFKPVTTDGQVLVDGGVANNLPVEIAKKMGADVLIVVDVGSPLVGEAELDSAFAITNQMLTILINSRSNEQKRFLSAEDVLILPELGRLGSQAFDQVAEAISMGEATARHSIARLRKFSVSEAAYAEHRQSLQRARSDNPVIQRITIENSSRLSPKVVEARLDIQRGEPLDVIQLESNIADIYGFDTFETVDYSIVPDATGNELRIRTKDKSWGPNYLRFGVNLEDDFSGTSDYNLAARFTKAEINPKGGEIRVDVVLGESPQLALELFQPLDYQSRWFINPLFRFQSSSSGLFDDGDQIAQLRSDNSEISLGVGRQFGNWGELRATLARNFVDNDIQVGDPEFGGVSSDTTSLTVNFGYDTIDNVAIPRFGTNFNIGWVGLREDYGAAVTADVASLFLVKPQTWGNNTLLHWWNVGTVTNSPETPFSVFELGGLFNLTGYAPGELSGEHVAMGRLLYYRRLGKSKVPLLNTPVYLGGSVEAGNTWQDTDAISFDNTLLAGSVFVVVDTIIGPLYLAYGAAEGRRDSAYLFLGQTF